MTIEKRLAELGVRVPEPRMPAGTYVPAMIHESLAYSAGQGSVDDSGHGIQCFWERFRSQAVPRHLASYRSWRRSPLASGSRTQYHPDKYDMQLVTFPSLFLNMKLSPLPHTEPANLDGKEE